MEKGNESSNNMFLWYQADRPSALRPTVSHGLPFSEIVVLLLNPFTL